MNLRELFPEMHELAVGEKNPNYLHSLFLGVTFPVINAPIMFWRLVLRPLLRSIWIYLLLLVSILVFGIFGRVSYRNITKFMAMVAELTKNLEGLAKDLQKSVGKMEDKD